MLKRKDKILISALELLNEGGVSNLTTKNLARKEGVSEPALYRQYKNKMAIIVAIIDEFASYDKQIKDTILESNYKDVEGIMYYVTMYSELYTNYYELTTVLLSLDLYYYNDITQTMMKKIIDDRLIFLENAIGAIKLQTPLTAYEMARLVDGIIHSQVYLWRMDGMSFDLKERIVNQVIKILK